MARNRKILLALLTIVVLAVGGFLFWFYVIKEDAPPALGSKDLDNALTTTTVSVPASADPGVATSTTVADAAVTTVAASPGPAASVDGTWSLVGADSTVGYRVKEILAGLETEGAGRTDKVTGTLTIAGTQASAASFEVDMTSITSNSDRRDNQFHGRIMSTAQFPTATFTLTKPIDFGTVPADGQSITTKATGDLTLRGVTRSVTFDVEAKLQSGRIGVLGNIPITFADYQIPNPSNAFADTEDHGLLEFVLVFSK